jgi:2-keto-4-pentenoate hydratase/2-oxohepta-3-ene-1,7-dioic acid hydratase in catechol pathway
MKLIRFGSSGKERPGLIDQNGRIRDLSGIVDDINGDAVSANGLAAIRNADVDTLPVVGGQPRLGPCIAGTRNFIAVGLNYADHAAEAGHPIPLEPIIFNKAPSCIVGPNDNVVVPKASTKLDWEIELGIIIGERARYVSQASALDYVAGYCVANDVTDRVFQFDRGGQWGKGKSCETFGPLGPWLVTKDEVPDPQNLDMLLTVNGAVKQKGSTRTMIFGVQYLVWHLSQFMVLEPGDVIVTGTPPGVGLGMKPPQFLKPGDVVNLSISVLGEQTQMIVELKDCP